MNRCGKVFNNDIFAGLLKEVEGGYLFRYSKPYLSLHDALPISFTLPIQKEAFESKTMFSFFDGLIPEGWLIEIEQKNWKLNPKDRMGLLLSCCKDCVGSVHIELFDEDADG